jgi:uncharacterized protein YjbI with pentapeptide repeats
MRRTNFRQFNVEPPNTKPSYGRLKMANPEHVQAVEDGTESLNKWRKKNPDVTLDLEDADLSHTELTDANLSGANLTRALLVCANLAGANFTNAKTQNAEFDGAEVDGAIGLDL